MHHGDTVLVLKDRILIGEKELSPIGIIDQSRCWARWMPDPRTNNKDDYTSHLVVSPFEISSWPILFKISVVLEDTETDIGNLTSILKILRDEDLNILSAEGTPAGHRHAIVNIIVEANRFKKGIYQDMFDIVSRYPARTLKKENSGEPYSKLDAFVHKRLVPEMLHYTHLLKEMIYKTNKNGQVRPDGHNAPPPAPRSFLRQTFIPYPEELLFKEQLTDAAVAEIIGKLLERSNEIDGSQYWADRLKELMENEDFGADDVRRGLIFSPKILKDELKKQIAQIRENDMLAKQVMKHGRNVIAAANRQFLKAVNCTWLQNHAYYWLYGKDEPKAKILKFDARHSSLKPEGEWAGDFGKMVTQFERDFPSKSISTTNYNEQYLRILLSKYDIGERTRQVKIPYSATFPKNGNTKGLLHTFCEAFSKRDLALRSVYISTEERDAQHERGEFTFLVTQKSMSGVGESDQDGQIMWMDHQINEAIKEGKKIVAEQNNPKTNNEKEKVEAKAKGDAHNATQSNINEIEKSITEDEIVNLGEMEQSRALKPGWLHLGDESQDYPDERSSNCFSKELPSSNLPKVEDKNTDPALRVTVGTARVSPLQSKILFLSTKFDWLEQIRPNLLGKLQRILEDKYGFDLLIAHNNFNYDRESKVRFKVKKHLEYLYDSNGALTVNIIKALKNSSAFLQIIPRNYFQSNESQNEQNWLAYEFGAALALDMPLAICVDTSAGKTMVEWRDQLKIQVDRPIFPFSTILTDSGIITQIESALDVLQKKVMNEGRVRTDKTDEKGDSP